ncbi:MAG: peptidylprolyl isomerase [Acidobacteria bacterium]|nr:MAG: peptidylprolyl isomerase [Acidobacteriota bacterium]
MHRARKTTGLLLALTIASSLGAQPTFQTIPQTTLLAGSPIHIPLDGRNPSGQALSFTAVSSDPLVTPKVLTGNRSLRIRVADFGVMVFELFDGRVRRATNRIVTLATNGFYNGIIFHRVINDFVLQGGDPTGTGAGGSTLGSFNDKFHVDLQHNRTGLLSMAKSRDDSNDSQFFITEGPQRHLDFNHSIFGILVEGEAVRQRISNVATGPDDRPITDVVMESVESFIDSQNAVLMLKAPEGATGTVDITVTVRNASGAETQQTFRVNVTPDLVNSPPFLAEIAEIQTPVNTAVTYQLIARDVEGDPALFLDQDSMAANGLQVPVVANENLQYVVDFNTGFMTVTPTNGLSGRHQISVATAMNINAVDYQVVPVVIGPAPENP